MDANSTRQSQVGTRVNALRQIFALYDIDGYIIPSTDKYQNEYVPDYARRLTYISGFTGSNGIAVILKDHALFFTDGRYLTQSEQELPQDIFTIYDQKYMYDFDWTKFIQQAAIAYDPKLFTAKLLKAFTKLPLKSIANNLVDQIWTDQPPKPSSPVYIYPIEFAGENREDKLSKCRQFLIEHKAEALIITKPDSVCWLLNIRASDVEFSPLMLGLVIITTNQVYLFVNDHSRLSLITSDLGYVIVLPEESLESKISEIEGKVLVDENCTSVAIMELLQLKEVKTITNPCILWQAVKNQAEINNAIDVHIKDAVAVCEFLAYINSVANLAQYIEYDLALYLTAQRAKQTGYVMDSFPTICGFQENSAVIHYRPTAECAKKIVGDGILLIDSGGHYSGATTDITRTIAIGTATNEQKQRYTQVLKGHIALATIKFPYNTSGASLDILARQFLWHDYQDYPHGTGHGVGNFLNVHEGPQSINQRNNTPLQIGMILSNEPGFYVAGSYGIRIENLMYVKQASDLRYLQFENLTLVPYEKSLIDLDVLTKDEIAYIENYYQKIDELVYPLLSPDAQKWLRDCNL